MDHKSGASKDQHGGGKEVNVKYRGVLRIKSGNYGALMKKSGKRVWLGTFPTPEAAARAYDRTAVALGRHINTLNFPNEHRTTIPTANASTPPAPVATATSSSSSSSMATREVIFEFRDLLDPDLYDDKVNK